MSKQCLSCFEFKKLKDFNKNETAKDGYRNHCRVCRRSYFRNYYQINKIKLYFNKTCDTVSRRYKTKN